MILREFTYENEKILVNADLVKYCREGYGSTTTDIYFSDTDKIRVNGSLEDTYYTLTEYRR